MIIHTFAKINIGLNIIKKRQDGFHDIETIFYPIPISDVIEVIPWQTDIFTIHGISLDIKPEENIIIKAYKKIKQDYDLPPLNITLLKKVPAGAGLGGGSADAAFMIKLLNETFNLKLTIQQMEKYASQLGADCAFFIKNKPAYATGKGDILEPVNINLKDYYIAIIKPDLSVSTKEAYSGVKPAERQRSLKKIIETTPLSEWKNYIKNDFEKNIFKKYPVLAEIKQKLYENSAIYASMTGSGSAIYGIFDRKPKLKNLFKKMFYYETDKLTY